MDWSNKEVLNNPNLSYTSRDYVSILTELTNAIPLLSKVYNPQSEADPGIVLIKAMSMLGDMLSYNLDNNALETFPRTVLQNKNAQQLFRLVGYKMRWYQSARCQAYFTNSNSVPVTLGRYSIFTSYTGITYTNLNQIEIPAGASGNTQYVTELVQGTPVTPPINGGSSLAYSNTDWHDIYGYNVQANSTVVDNRIYLQDVRVDGSTIILIDDDDTAFADLTWKRVDNLNTITEVGKHFEFDFDETGAPFIQLPEYWNTRYAITRFKLFYVISDGEAGEIVDNSLCSIGEDKVYISGSTSTRNFMDNVKIYNKASTYGYSPETPEEARAAAELYVNTMDTLVTLDDFTKATKRITGVANAIATDKQTDPDGQNLLSNQIKLYIIRKPGYETGYEYDDYGSSDYYVESDELNDDVWKTSVVDELNSYKLSKYDIDVALESAVDWIEWTIEGSLWLRQPVPSDKNHDIMVKINDNLDHTFSPSKLDFNEAINYIDVIDNIKSSDKLIYHVDLNSAAIKYSRIRRDTDGNPTGLTTERKWRIYDSNTNLYTNYYATGFGCRPVPGGTGTFSNVPDRIMREDGSIVAGGLANLGVEVSELEIYGDDHIMYNWVQEERIDTGYYIGFATKNENDEFELNPHGNEDNSTPVIVKHVEGGADEITTYWMQERIAIILADGFESGEYLIRNFRDISGRSEEEDGFTAEEKRPVYDIMNSYDEWTGKFIDYATGEIFIRRSGHVYSTKRYYKTDGYLGEIVDGFGSYVYDEFQNLIYDPVTKEELTGRYEQMLELNELVEDENGDMKRASEYSFFLGQDKDGNPLIDELGHEIVGFPIKPDGFHVYIDTDRYVLHDNGKGVITGSAGALNGPGSINYETGEVKFNLAIQPHSSMKIIYYKNNIAMARYNQFDVNKFYTQPQFLRYSDANRTLG